MFSTFKSKLITMATVALLTLGSLSLSTDVMAQDLNDLSKDQLDKIIHDYIMANPDVLIRSIDTFYKEQEKLAKTDENKLLSSVLPVLKTSDEYPIGGNPKGSVTLVEFFDYQCGYCKRVLKQVKDIMEDDDDLRVVFVELPILGPESVIAAQAALAAKEQGKYVELHLELMGARGGLNEERILSIAESIGLDMDQLVKDMQSSKTKDQINRNRQLSQMLNISGTPAFIIGDEVARGAIDEDQMKAMIDLARQEAKEAKG